MAALSVLLSLLGAWFLEYLLYGEGKVEWCGSSASTMSGLGCVVQWSPDVRCALMDSHMVEALSGVVAASMVGPVRGFLRSITLEMARREVVEVTSGECAQGVIFGLCRRVGVR
jgi:hypothetical protein